jgi:nucleoside-diphosphate-sugar epimerase
VRALVTGSSGFLGRHFTAELERRGWDVTAWDVVTGQCALAGFRYVPDSCANVDLVVHCAAVSPHRAAIDGRAVAVGAGNLELDAAMFAWAARTRPGRVVYLSSSAAYPVDLQNDLAQPRELSETDIQTGACTIGAPDAIYGWTKLTGERLAQAYREHGAVTVLRPFSGYGENQPADWPFGAFRDRALARQDPFQIWGDGAQVRDWVHVSDVVSAALSAADAGLDGPLNVCTGVGTSMRELAELFCDQAGYRPAFRTLPSAPAGVAYRVGDPSLLHTLYVPRICLAEGVKRALAEGA